LAYLLAHFRKETPMSLPARPIRLCRYADVAMYAGSVPMKRTLLQRAA